MHVYLVPQHPLPFRQPTLQRVNGCIFFTAARSCLSCAARKDRANDIDRHAIVDLYAATEPGIHRSLLRHHPVVPGILSSGWSSTIKKELGPRMIGSRNANKPIPFLVHTRITRIVRLIRKLGSCCLEEEGKGNSHNNLASWRWLVRSTAQQTFPVPHHTPWESGGGYKKPTRNPIISFQGFV